MSFKRLRWHEDCMALYPIHACSCSICSGGTTIPCSTWMESQDTLQIILSKVPMLHVLT